METLWNITENITKITGNEFREWINIHVIKTEISYKDSINCSMETINRYC